MKSFIVALGKVFSFQQKQNKLLYSFAKELFNVGLTLYCHGLGIALQ
jgi:hypothetical protein